MKSWPPAYPDILDILARKAAGRRQLASLSFGENSTCSTVCESASKPMRAAPDGSVKSRR